MLVLGSTSKARRVLLESSGIKPTRVISPLVDESQLSNETPLSYVKRISTLKAENLDIFKDEILITADTIVVIGTRILHKTDMKNTAREYLQMISGRRHVVYTSVCLKKENKYKVFFEKTTLKARLLKEKEIEGYLQGKEWIGAAGAYKIQGSALSFFTFISGCYSNVIGLPIPRLMLKLDGLGILK